MSEFYDNASATARNLIERFGQELRLVRVESINDPVTGKSSTTYQNFHGYGAVFPIDKKLADGTRILMSDQEIYITTSYKLKVGDIIMLEDQLIENPDQGLTIVELEHLAPAGLDVLHKAIARR